MPCSGYSITVVYSPFDEWKNQARKMLCVLEDAVDRRPVLAGRSHSLLHCALLQIRSWSLLCGCEEDQRRVPLVHCCADTGLKVFQHDRQRSFFAVVLVETFI
jgi:hypothetical protein